MKITLKNISLPTTNKLVLSEFYRETGLSAGICYMPNTYETLTEKTLEQSEKTAKFALGNGHHSVADHIQCSFIIEECSKALAMVLNNLGVYATSEKSARYTVMKNLPQYTQDLYDKWTKKLIVIIHDKYPKIEEKQVTKLAMENARLFISIFAPATTMQYTMSIRQANYLIDWIERFINEPHEDNYFYIALTNELLEFQRNLREMIYVPELRDHKKRELNFVEHVLTPEYKNETSYFGAVYNTFYRGSFAMFAQAQRHRTLNYKIFFDGEVKNFYIPPIIEDDPDLSQEWYDDMKSVKITIPQGTWIEIQEQGTLENFKLKCTERMCGRAQLEIMHNTIDTYNKYKKELTKQNSPLLNSLLSYDSNVKCQFMECKEPCMWGKNATTRLI